MNIIELLPDAIAAGQPVKALQDAKRIEVSEKELIAIGRAMLEPLLLDRGNTQIKHNGGQRVYIYEQPHNPADDEKPVAAVGKRPAAKPKPAK